MQCFFYVSLNLDNFQDQGVRHFVHCIETIFSDRLVQGQYQNCLKKYLQNMFIANCMNVKTDGWEDDSLDSLVAMCNL